MIQYTHISAPNTLCKRVSASFMIDLVWYVQVITHFRNFFPEPICQSTPALLWLIYTHATVLPIRNQIALAFLTLWCFDCIIALSVGWRQCGASWSLSRQLQGQFNPVCWQLANYRAICRALVGFLAKTHAHTHTRMHAHTHAHTHTEDI